MGRGDPRAGSVPWCSRQGLRGGVEAGGQEQLEARHTRHPPGHTIPHRDVYPGGEAPGRQGGRAGGTRPPSHNPAPWRTLGPRGRGGEGPGRGRPGRKLRALSAAGGAGGCRAGRGPWLPVCALVRCCFPPELVGPPGPTLPMAQTPDGISCELRGKHWLFPPSWPGGSSAAPKSEAHPAPRRARSEVLSAPQEGGRPRSSPFLPRWPQISPRAPAWHRLRAPVAYVQGPKSSSRLPFHRRDHQIPVAQRGGAAAENLATRGGCCAKPCPGMGQGTEPGRQLWPHRKSLLFCPGYQTVFPQALLRWRAYLLHTTCLPLRVSPRAWPHLPPSSSYLGKGLHLRSFLALWALTLHQQSAPGSQQEWSPGRSGCAPGCPKDWASMKAGFGAWSQLI